MARIGINFSHNIKADSIAILHFEEEAVANGETAQVHAAGCAHARKAYRSVPLDQSGPDFQAGIMQDDYFYVAPCARKA